jgi:hypothetical protein
MHFPPSPASFDEKVKVKIQTFLKKGHVTARKSQRREG